MDLKKIIERVENHAKNVLSEKRFSHSLRVAKTAEFLCEKFKIEGEKGYLAGIAHDICREKSDDELILLCSQEKLEISIAEKQKPALLHGKAAAIVLKKNFSILDEDILEAVSFHTSGKKNLCDLAKILYIADKTEPARPQANDEYRKTLYAKNLLDATIFVAQENEEYLKNRGKILTSDAKEFLLDLKNQKSTLYL